MPKNQKSPTRVSTSNTNPTYGYDTYYIPDVHGSFSTLILECMNCIQGFTWNGQESFKEALKTEELASLADLSLANNPNDPIISFFNNNEYPISYVEDLKNDKSKVAEYAAIEGNVHIQQLKDQLALINLTPDAKNTKMIFVGDLLADRQTNSIFMLHTFSAMKRAGLNFKIIFSNHDEIFFQVYAGLKSRFDQLDQDKLTDINYIKTNIIQPLRDLVSNEANNDRSYIYAYASLIRMVFTIEKQIYEIEAYNKSLGMGQVEQSLVTGIAEMISLVNDAYLPNLELANIEDLQTSTNNSRRYLATHAPQALLSKEIIKKNMIDLIKQKPDGYLHKINNVLRIYASPHMVDYVELNECQKYIDAFNNKNIDQLRQFVLFHMPEDFNDETLVNEMEILAMAEKFLLKKLDWFFNNRFEMPELIDQFINYAKQFEGYQPAYNNFENNLDNIYKRLLSVKKWLSSGVKHPFLTEDMHNVFHKNNDYISNMILLCDHLAFVSQNNIDLNAKNYSISLRALFDYIKLNDRYSKYALGSDEYVPGGNQKINIRQYLSFFQNLESMYEKVQSIDPSNFYTEANAQIIKNAIDLLTQEGIDTSLISQTNDPQIKNIILNLFKRLDHNVFNQCRSDIIYISKRVLINRIATICTNMNYDFKLPTSILDMWLMLVADAQAKLNASNNLTENDITYRNQINIMASKYNAYEKFLFRSLTATTMNSAEAQTGANVLKLMVADMNQIISNDPSLICERSADNERSPIQKKIYDFIWNRGEIRGDFSGTSLFCSIFGHTGNAVLEEGRHDQVSLDLQNSKLDYSRLRFFGNRTVDTKPSKPQEKPHSLFFTPASQEKNKRKFDGSGDEDRNPKKINR